MHRRKTHQAPQTPQQGYPSYNSNLPYGANASRNSRSYDHDERTTATNFARSSYTSKRRRRRRWPLIALIAAVVAVIIIVIVALSNCSNGSSNTSTSDAGPLETTNSYDWSNLSWEDDRPAYYDGPFLRSELGVDVSDHQEYIDWEAVANDGISFASVRVGNRGYTEGTLHTDEYADYNLDAAKDAGLKVGAYFYSQATSTKEAIEEAELTLEVLDGRSLDLPVVFDHERVPNADGRANDITGEELADITTAYCDRIEQEGYKTMVYGNPSDLSRYVGVSFGNRQIWLAQYETNEPTVRFEFAVWQYTDNGTVDGIDSPADMDIRFLDANL